MANDVDYGLSNKKEKRDIKYIGREFSSIRANLLEYAKSYYPTAYNDFNESSPGMMFIELYYTPQKKRKTFIRLHNHLDTNQNYLIQHQYLQK